MNKTIFLIAQSSLNLYVTRKVSENGLGTNICFPDIKDFFVRYGNFFTSKVRRQTNVTRVPYESREYCGEKIRRFDMRANFFPCVPTLVFTNFLRE